MEKRSRTIKQMIKKILYLTQTRPAYSLNSVFIKGLKKNNVEVAECYVKRDISGFKKALSFYRENIKGADAIIIGFDSPLLATLLGLFSFRKKVIFNAILSVYERNIISRKLVSAFSIKAIYYWLIDFMAVHFSDLVLLESDRQINFFKKIFLTPGDKLLKRYIGVDEDNFYFDPSVEKFPKFTVIFRGLLMPEAGAEYVIRAAKKLENENIRFLMLSGGMLLDKIDKLRKEINPLNLELRSDLLSYEELRSLMQKSHLSLGQLSEHTRLERTIPHKAYESMIMKLPYLTAANKGILELLRPGQTCITCEPADADSLADKILWAKNNPSELERIAGNAYSLYVSRLNSKFLAGKILDHLGR